MKYLCIDYGKDRVGIAVSDEKGGIAFPRPVEQNDEGLLKRIIARVEEERVESIVVGDTKTFSGKENTITADAEEFAKELSSRAGLPLRMVSEAWSSREAARFAPEGEKNDSATAAVILQRFLDMRQSEK